MTVESDATPAFWSPMDLCGDLMAQAETDDYPLIGEGWSNPEQHTCEYPTRGVLCMETAVGAIYSGWTDYVWLCQPHLDGETAKGWEQVDFTEDEDDG